ncbi:MAG: DUF1858 domain-containing protein [Deltaproteobacteria bacterium]|nr:DUF1858 domain-containing protein [Deltaproteobacteria bacterium]
MSTEVYPITPNTKVATLLEHYPQLEDTLIEMAPPFKKLRNPILRRSVAKVASLRQAAKVGRLPAHQVVNALRAAVGQSPLDPEPGAEDETYFTDQPRWFDEERISVSLDESKEVGDDEMAVSKVLKQGNRLSAGEILELRTTFLPVPGIDIMRAKGFETWSVEDAPDQIRTYFTRA